MDQNITILVIHENDRRNLPITLNNEGKYGKIKYWIKLNRKADGKFLSCKNICENIIPGRYTGKTT